MQRQLKSLPAGAGYGWVELSGFMRENFSGAYNCTSTNVVDWRFDDGSGDDGCGTGAVLEPRYLSTATHPQSSHIVTGEIGTTPAPERRTNGNQDRG